MALDWSPITGVALAKIAPEITDLIFKPSPAAFQWLRTPGISTITGIKVVTDPYMPAGTMAVVNTSGLSGGAYVTGVEAPIVYEKPKRQKRQRSAPVEPISFERVISFED